ncbi:hypothetical protein EYR36_011795 [Pleurotus pulmonarius]|nr:hypothetical protein EYR36_011795 [Pleurotus pulmonarius]
MPTYTSPVNRCLDNWLGVSTAWKGNVLIVVHGESGEPVQWLDKWEDHVKSTLRRLISITPLEVAIGLHIAKSRKQQSTCSHKPVDQDYVAGNSGKLLPEVLENIFLFADLQTLIEAAKINTIVRDATRMAFKRLVKDKMRSFFGEDIMPQFFAELRKARGYICGDVPLSIVLHAKWMLSELHIAVPRGGKVIRPGEWGYMTPSFKPTTVVFIGRILDQDSGTDYGIFPSPAVDALNLEELPPGRLVLGNPGRGNMVLDKFYVKQMEHLREMMELEAAEMGLTIIKDGIMPRQGTIDDRIHVNLNQRYTARMGAFLDGPREHCHVGAMYPLRDVPDEKTRALLGHSTSAVIQQAIFDKSFQLVKPWEETDALSSGTLISVEAQLRMQNVGDSLVMYDPVHARRIQTMQPTLATDVDIVTFTRLYRRPMLSQQGFIGFSRSQEVACTQCKDSIPPRDCQPSESSLRCTECKHNISCTLYANFRKATLCERFNLSSERYDEKVEEMVVSKATGVGDVDSEDHHIHHDAVRDTGIPAWSQRTPSDERYESTLQQMAKVTMAEPNVLKVAMDNTYEAYTLMDEYSQRVATLENERTQLLSAMSQLQKEKDELQGILTCQRSLEASARQTFSVGPEGVSVPVLATFLVAEMGHWVSMESHIGNARASGPGSVTLSSSVAENARQQCLERIRFLRTWMSNLMPSIPPEVDAIIQAEDFPDDLDRVMRLEEAISNEMNALKDRRQHERQKAEDREKERQKAKAELAEILSRDVETRRLMADLAAKRAELLSILQSEEATTSILQPEETTTSILQSEETTTSILQSEETTT